jgi:hypothetical protein
MRFDFGIIKTHLSLTPRPSPSKSVILKNGLLLVFQKRRLRLDTNKQVST